jgi:polygalacturonase
MKLINLVGALALGYMAMAPDRCTIASDAGEAATRESLAADDFVPPKVPLPTFPDRSFNVKDFGAAGDGQANDTAAVNQAIERSNREGGGTIHFPAGKYMVASVHLMSNMQLLLDDAAVIEGLKEGYDPPETNAYDKYQDFGHSHFHNAVMWGENIENFAVIGGQVNGGGVTTGNPKPGGGDKVFAIKVGKNLLFKNVTHMTGGHFVYLLNDCENVTIEHDVIKKSRDAIDLMGCRNVAVTGCHYTGCGDDTLGIKSDYALGRRIKSQNIYAWDNYFESGCNALQFGSETAGDFEHIRIWNIKIGLAMKAGIGITCNDSARIKDVRYQNIEIKGATNPIYMLITDRLRTGEKNVTPGTIKDIVIRDVTAGQCAAGRQGGVNPTSITGLPDYQIENVTLENVKIVMPGGGASQDADVVPPYPKDYSPRSLGPRPASALFMRNVRGLTLKNISVSFEKPDGRPPLAIMSADGVTLDHVSIADKPADAEMMRLTDVKNLSIHDSPGMPEVTKENVAKGKK